MKKSITLRLCLFVGLSILLIQIFMSVAVYYIIRSDFLNDAGKFLNNEVSVINNLLVKHKGDYSALDQEVIWEPQSDDDKFMVKILDNNGQLVRESKHFTKRFKNVSWPSVTKGVSDIKIVRVGHKTYTLISAILIPPQQNQYKVMVAYNITRDDHMLSHLISNLAILTAVTIVLMLVLVILFVGLGLRPLRRMSEQIKRIDIEKLDKRLDEAAIATELLPIVRAFNMLLNRIQQDVEKLKLFSANIAHELRTPINNLMVETELLLSQPLPEVKTKEILMSSMEEYSRLASIIERMLFLARYDERKGKLNKQKIDVAKELELVIDFHQALADKKQIEISLSGKGFAYVDPTLFRNALTNVVTNAVKYCNTGDKISITLQQQSNETIIIIKDTGPGVSETDIERLTEKFYRVDSHRSSATGGSGLGLAIVESIVNAHNGKLSFAKNEPHGLIVRLSFPNL